MVAMFPAWLAFCESGGAVTPQISLEDLNSGKVAEQRVIWGLSGTKLPLVVDLVAPLGSSGSLDCGIFQASEELAAKLPGGGELVSDVSFSDRTFQRLEVQVPMPEVDRETKFLVVISLKSKSDGKILASAKRPVCLLPGFESELNPVTRLRHLPDDSLIVTGESPRIRAFLDQRKIPYLDGLPASSEMSGVLLCEGQDMPVNLPSGLTAILFSKSERMLPGVYPAMVAGGSRIKVTLPVLDSIATDVLAQKTFADLILAALPKPSTTEP